LVWRSIENGSGQGAIHVSELPKAEGEDEKIERDLGKMDTAATRCNYDVSIDAGHLIVSRFASHEEFSRRFRGDFAAEQFREVLDFMCVEMID